LRAAATPGFEEAQKMIDDLHRISAHDPVGFGLFSTEAFWR
jgi:hypothetical protein